MQLHPWRRATLRVLVLSLALIQHPRAHETAEEVVVYGRALDLSHRALSAAQGYVGANEVGMRPMLRAGELLEVVPGSVVTQHSGTGKANQYFLRGFNLDHGTDFAGFLDGVPLNLPTHGHGQGYLDLNPIIPELVDAIAYGKGPYCADVGDFSSAGYARYRLATHRHGREVQLGLGANGFYRGVASGSHAAAGGTALYGFEAQHYDGPWVVDANAHKLNGLIKYTRPLAGSALELTLTAYDAEWDATDQVPQRAIDRDLIGRRGSIDPTLGGASQRYSLNAAVASPVGTARGGFASNAYLVYSDFTLYSNFTYLLDDPLRGDQITQADRRWLMGMNSEYVHAHELLSLHATTRFGMQLRHDRLLDVALGRSRARELFAITRDDTGEQTSLGFYLTNETALTAWLRAVPGLRVDKYWFEIESLLAANSGTSGDTKLSPKFGLVFGPWWGNEFYLNAGRGFHSNDARGTLTVVDPTSGDAATPVPPLVESEGVEVGWRTNQFAGLQSTISAWYLELDSELVFVGDAGSTEPSGASRRYGVEWSNYYRPRDWLSFDLDLALTQAKFRGVDADEVPNSVGRVVTAGVALGRELGPFAALRVRHFGDSPLIEDGRAHADATTVVNLRAGYRLNRALARLSQLGVETSQFRDFARRGVVRNQGVGA